MKFLSLFFSSMRLASSLDKNHVPICRDAEIRDAAIKDLCGDDNPGQVTGVENRENQTPVQFGQGWKLS